MGAMSGYTQESVKRVLRRRDSKEFFDGEGWTGDQEQAKHFSDVIEVAETCARRGLMNVEIALYVDKCQIFTSRVR